jgi:hypothetical protein
MLENVQKVGLQPELCVLGMRVAKADTFGKQFLLIQIKQED